MKKELYQKDEDKDYLLAMEELFNSCKNEISNFQSKILGNNFVNLLKI